MQQIQIVGNLGKDAEIINISGKDYTKFSVGVTEKKKNDQTTTWFSVIFKGVVLQSFFKNRN